MDRYVCGTPEDIPGLRRPDDHYAITDLDRAFFDIATDVMATADTFLFGPRASEHLRGWTPERIAAVRALRELGAK